MTNWKRFSDAGTQDFGLKLHDLGDHPKAATYDQFKTGHSEGLRHTH